MIRMVALTLLLAACATSECNCDRSNQPCAVYGFKHQQERVCGG